MGRKFNCCSVYQCLVAVVCTLTTVSEHWIFVYFMYLVGYFSDDTYGSIINFKIENKIFASNYSMCIGLQMFCK